MTRPIPDVPIAGLLVPADVAARVITALRATYPSVAEGLDDNGVVRAVLIHWIASTLIAYEGDAEEASVEDAVAQVRKEYIDRATKAREKAQADASRIREAPSGVTEPADVTTPDATK